MVTSISVLTIVKSRQQALLHMVAGLAAGDLLPAELIVVHMNEPAQPLGNGIFPVKTFELSDDGHLPLAAARNFAVSQASCEYVVFLDVDCIPATDLLRRYAEAFRLRDQLWTGPVRYLRHGATAAPGFFGMLDELSNPDPVRGALSSVSYELFWSLNFGCSRQVFGQIGGFDEGFTGYGAEDTDFSFTARNRGVLLGAVNALAYHQHHASYDPPLNHFEDIIKNARTFYKKWGIWPMEGWLKKFAALGLINWNHEAIEILRYPEKNEIEATLKR